MHINNKFNITFHMSASLPRIKTFHEVSRPSNTESQKDLKLKFRKLMLDGAENGEERKKSIKTLKTQRLKSLERYTTTQEQRDFKNEKIHLNLIERKLLTGTYDEQKQTGSQLNVLKQKRDQMKVEMNLKQREIERVKLLLDDVKQEIQGFMAKKGEYEEKLKEIKDKHELQLAKTETARQTRSVFENMAKAREQINMVLKKRHNQMKDGMGHLTSGINLMDNQLREISEKCAVRESKLDQLLKTAVKQRQERNNEISKHQDKINKRIEGQILQAQKSKKYISHLDQVQRQAEQRDFHGIYDKILANLFVAKYCKGKMLGLQQKYEIYENSYNRLTSYKSFDKNNPKSLVDRFQEHQPQNSRMQQQITQKEQLVAKLEHQEQQLKKNKAQVNMDSEQMEEKFLKSTLPLEVNSKQREQIEEAKKEVEELQQKNIRIRTYILGMLKSLNQKGDKKIQSSIQASVTNVQLLTQVLRESYRQLQ